MFHSWNDAVAPVVEAAGARCIGELGALWPEIGEVMLERLGRDVELHGEFPAVRTGERHALAFDRGGIARSVS